MTPIFRPRSRGRSGRTVYELRLANGAMVVDFGDAHTNHTGQVRITLPPPVEGPARSIALEFTPGEESDVLDFFEMIISAKGNR